LDDLADISQVVGIVGFDWRRFDLDLNLVVDFDCTLDTAGHGLSLVRRERGGDEAAEDSLEDLPECFAAGLGDVEHVEHAADPGGDDCPAAGRGSGECDGHDVFGLFEGLLAGTLLDAPLAHELSDAFHWRLREVFFLQRHVDVVNHENTFFETCNWTDDSTLS
jgi:hypothetical protein